MTKSLSSEKNIYRKQKVRKRKRKTRKQKIMDGQTDKESCKLDVQFKIWIHKINAQR